MEWWTVFISEGGAARCPDHSDQAYCLHKVSVTITIITVFYPHIPTMTQYHHAGILSVMIMVGIYQWQNPTVDYDDDDDDEKWKQCIVGCPIFTLFLNWA